MNSRADWKSELASAFRDSHTLSQFLGWSLPVLDNYPVLVPRQMAELIKAQGPQGVLARQFLPSSEENGQGGFVDPIADQTFAQTKQLIHRYENRALLLPTTVCPVNCRYCFRKNELEQDSPFAPDREATLNYLLNHREIEEVIFTGGDPLILSDEKLAAWLELLAQIPHLRFVRFHSRVPVVLPTRLSHDLAQLLTEYRDRFQFILVTHTNHVSEWSSLAQESVRAFTVPGLVHLSQSVLLKGVNNDRATLKALFYFLHHQGIRPYYLHHPDVVRGGLHFWLPLEEGRKLWSQLHNQVPGWILPQYVLDSPLGRGKVAAFNPESFSFSGQLIDRHGQIYTIDQAILNPHVDSTRTSQLV